MHPVWFLHRPVWGQVPEAKSKAERGRCWRRARWVEVGSVCSWRPKLIFSSFVRSRVSRRWVETNLRNGWEWSRGRNSYHNHRPETLESLIQTAGMGLLAPVSAKLPSFCLPALEWYGKMPLESSLPVGRGKLHQGHAQTQGHRYGSLA